MKDDNNLGKNHFHDRFKVKNMLFFNIGEGRKNITKLNSAAENLLKVLL